MSSGWRSGGALSRLPGEFVEASEERGRKRARQMRSTPGPRPCRLRRWENKRAGESSYLLDGLPTPTAVLEGHSIIQKEKQFHYV